MACINILIARDEFTPSIRNVVWKEIIITIAAMVNHQLEVYLDGIEHPHFGDFGVDR
jgi:hypothetical protein